MSIDKLTERKIIYWKLIKPYAAAVRSICRVSEQTDITKISVHSSVVKLLLEAEVLNVWFEPVYEQLTKEAAVQKYEVEHWDAPDMRRAITKAYIAGWDECEKQLKQ